jgi:pyruvate/2-oxoglutarate dehydrogenase complex dihydrolipoamide acyltransferase (E2) component
MFKVNKFPKSRIATLDICNIGVRKHHVAAFIEVDVTEAREKIKKYKREISRISFNAWLIKVISKTIKANEGVAGYLKGKRSVLIFDDINVSIVVEKDIDGQKVPIPLLIHKASDRSIESITEQINSAKKEQLTNNEIVLHRKTNWLEQFYYILPGFLRRFAWRYMLKNPKTIFNKMGNVAITSIGMMGNVNGWFIPISVHPICFGIGSIIKKPIVLNDKIEIRQMLNMSILIDHDVIDGAPMARFIRDLTNNIEKGNYLE